MEQKIGLLKRKNIEFSVKRYAQEAFSAFALGLFASLLIGLIIKTLGEQLGNISWIGEKNVIIVFLIATGTTAMGLMGPAIGVAVSWALKAPPFVIFASVVTGALGAELGGPAGAFVAAAVGAEFGKLISKETKLDIILTPAVTVLAGALTATVIGPLVQKFMEFLGNAIMMATEWQPFFLGIFIAIIVGLALTGPISSAALCIMLGLTGLAAGAATVGGCAQMIGFAVISFKDNGIGGLFAQGLGTSKLQMGNVVKNPWILLPPTLAAAILGPLSTVVFKMTNNAMGAGMGTSGLVGQIGTLTDMGFTLPVLIKILILQIALPAILAFASYWVLRKKGKIKDGDMKLVV